MNSFERRVFHDLIRKYQLPEWLVIPQVKTNTGAAGTYGSGRFIDFFVVNLWPSKGYKCIAIEAKATIADFRKDIAEPTKQVLAKMYSDEFYYLLPVDVVEKHRAEINKVIFKRKDCNGLMTFDLETGAILVDYNPSHRRIKSPFTMGFIASLIRNAYKIGANDELFGLGELDDE